MVEAEEVMCVGDAGSGIDDYTKLASEPAVRTVCAGKVSCSGCAFPGDKCCASDFATVCLGLDILQTSSKMFQRVCHEFHSDISVLCRPFAGITLLCLPRRLVLCFADPIMCFQVLNAPWSGDCDHKPRNAVLQSSLRVRRRRSQPK